MVFILNIREENHISSYLPDDKDAGLGRTSAGLAIKHYALGKGSKHILILGGEHGNDIINSQAIYYLMSYLSNKTSIVLSNNFVPNPLFWSDGLIASSNTAFLPLSFITLIYPQYSLLLLTST